MRRVDSALCTGGGVRGIGAGRKGDVEEQGEKARRAGVDDRVGCGQSSRDAQTLVQGVAGRGGVIRKGSRG